MEESAGVETEKNDRNEELIEIVMNGGPPWGFTISGGSEFGTDLFVKRVSCLFCLFTIRCEVCLKAGCVHGASMSSLRVTAQNLKGGDVILCSKGFHHQSFS